MNNIKVKDIPFPECYKECEVVKILGVGECESFYSCRWKFKEYKKIDKKFSIDELHKKMKVDE